MLDLPHDLIGVNACQTVGGAHIPRGNGGDHVFMFAHIFLWQFVIEG